MKILILGAGKIGTVVAHLLQSVNDYHVVLVDKTFTIAVNDCFEKVKCDIQDEKSFNHLLKSYAFDAVISCLPFYLNMAIAKKAREYHLHYFDLTEDIKTTEAIEKIAKDANTVFIPQCGLAPGFVSIAACSLMQDYDEVESVLLRAGALPQHSSNSLHYALTWSTDGLINEYGNPCEMISEGEYVLAQPLENIEQVILDGVTYEAFNTSGGINSLWKSYLGKVKTMNYKTLRYPGHCEKIKFLMNDLNLNHHRDQLKLILQEVIPITYQDVVVVHITVMGKKNDDFIERNYTRKFYPEKINHCSFTAIQLSTANSICTIVDMILTKKYSYQGFVTQEQFSLQDFIENRFGQYYA